MKQTTYVHDFDNFSFFYNIIQSKLFEAEKDLKKLELYKKTPDFLALYTLNDIADTYEEQSDFITIVYAQCAVWRERNLTLTQISKLNGLDKMTQRLENTVYHVLFLVEQLQKMKATPVGEEECTDIHATRH